MNKIWAKIRARWRKQAEPKEQAEQRKQAEQQKAQQSLKRIEERLEARKRLYQRLGKSWFWVVWGVLLVVLLPVLLAGLIPLAKALIPGGGLGPEASEAAAAAASGGLRIETLKLLTTMLGGLLVAVGLYLSYRRTKVLDGTLKETQQHNQVLSETLEETRRSNQETQRSNKATQLQSNLKNAIEHLGHGSQTIRIGGIYELRQLAKDHETQRSIVQKIYCSYLRKRTNEEDYIETYTPKKGPAEEVQAIKGPAEEVQAILDVLCKEDLKDKLFESTQIQLQGAQLQGAYLKGANLEWANLEWANLQRAWLAEAKLQWAFLYRANLHGANLKGASLQGVNLHGANLQWAKLQEAHLERANLQWANLHGANLEGAELQGAIIWRSSVRAGADELAPEKLADLQAFWGEWGWDIEQQDSTELVESGQGYRFYVLNAKPVEPPISLPLGDSL